jgi:phage virion morphogenesis protein
MSDDLYRLEEWAGALLFKLQPAQRRALGNKVAIELRRSQAKRIAAQTSPDGAAYPPRKKRKELRGKKGRIKRQKAAMFNRLRTASWLETETDERQIAVGFFKKVARVARVHQEGLADKVAPRGPKYQYPARPLLGFSVNDEEVIRRAILRHISRGTK